MATVKDLAPWARVVFDRSLPQVDVLIGSVTLGQVGDLTPRGEQWDVMCATNQFFLVNSGDTVIDERQRLLPQALISSTPILSIQGRS